MFALLPHRALETSKVSWQKVQYITAPRGSAKPRLSIWDQLAAPTVFLELCLVYPQLDSTALKAALQHTVNAYPALASRLFTNPQDGRLCLKHAATAGAAFMEGHAPNLTLQQLLDSVTSSTAPPADPSHNSSSSSSRSPPSEASSTGRTNSTSTPLLVPLVVPELPQLLFGHLPGGLIPAYLNKPTMPLASVALVHLTGGGCVLGLRLSHLLGGGVSLRLLLRQLMQGYNYAIPQLREEHQGQEQQQQDDEVCKQGEEEEQQPVNHHHLVQPQERLGQELQQLAVSTPASHALVVDATAAPPQGTPERQAQQQVVDASRAAPPTTTAADGLVVERPTQLEQLAVSPTHPKAAAGGATAAAAATAPGTPAGLVLPAAVEPTAAGLLPELEDIARDVCPWGFQPVRLKVMDAEDGGRFAALARLSSSGNHGSSSGSSEPVRLTYYVSPGFIQRLKAVAAAAATAAAAASAEAVAAADASPTAAAAAASAEGGEATSCDVMFQQRHTISYDATFSTHNVLVAHLFKAFCKLPGRQLLGHDLSISIDMRPRIGSAMFHQLPVQCQEALPRAFGNFFATGIAEGLLPAELTLAQLAKQVAQAIHMGARYWLPDLAWAAGVMAPAKAPAPADPAPLAAPPAAAPAAAGGAAASSSTVTGLPPVPEASAASFSKMTPPKLHAGPPKEAPRPQPPQQQPQVTWRRLHAMGPRSQLEQQMLLGCIPALSTTQWSFDESEDACMGGAVPLLCVPAFSQPQPYPLVLSLKAPQRLGGGVMLHLFLDGLEADAMQRTLESS